MFLLDDLLRGWENFLTKTNFSPLSTLNFLDLTFEYFFQVVKWMLSKGQGTTMGTYGQLIRALDMDHRAEEAHEFWVKKIGTDLHSVPWHLCHRMISVYYRNNMLENLVKVPFPCTLFRSILASCPCHICISLSSFYYQHLVLEMVLSYNLASSHFHWTMMKAIGFLLCHNAIEMLYQSNDFLVFHDLIDCNFVSGSYAC